MLTIMSDSTQQTKPIENIFTFACFLLRRKKVKVLLTDYKKWWDPQIKTMLGFSAGWCWNPELLELPSSLMVTTTSHFENPLHYQLHALNINLAQLHLKCIDVSIPRQKHNNMPPRIRLPHFLNNIMTNALMQRFY